MRLTSVDCLTLRYGARSALRKRTRRQYWDGGVPVQWPSIWEYQRQPFSVSGQNDEVMTRGCGWFAPPKALARKRLAATVSRLAERRKSMVAPVESTARYKYTHLPLTRM